MVEWVELHLEGGRVSSVHGVESSGSEGAGSPLQGAEILLQERYGTQVTLSGIFIQILPRESSGPISLEAFSSSNSSFWDCG